MRKSAGGGSTYPVHVNVAVAKSIMDLHIDTEQERADLALRATAINSQEERFRASKFVQSSLFIPAKWLHSQKNTQAQTQTLCSAIKPRNAERSSRPLILACLSPQHSQMSSNRDTKKRDCTSLHALTCTQATHTHTDTHTHTQTHTHTHTTHTVCKNMRAHRHAQAHTLIPAIRPPLFHIYVSRLFSEKDCPTTHLR